MKPDEKARVRRFAPKTRHGCLTCKRRHTRCDERKPICQACERLGLKCMGYVIPKTWIFESSKDRNSSPDGDRQIADDASRGARTGSEDAGVSRLQSSSYIPRSLLSTVDEPAVIMEAYLQLATSCPMAWDSVLYHSHQRNVTFTVDDTGALWSPTNGTPLPGPLRYHSYFALATSTLTLFEPSRYPIQLHLKYLHHAVAEMRQLIAHNSFGLEDLLHGISKTLLASVLQGDFESARAHLGAAAGLVNQQGGMQAIGGQVAATLRYADFQLAVESFRAPAFPLNVDTSNRPEVDLSIVDPQLVHHAESIKLAAKSSTEPTVALLAIDRLLDGTLVLAHAFASSAETRVNVQVLDWVASYTAETMYLLLSCCVSVFQKSDPVLAAQRSQQSTDLNDWNVILLMWAQLLVCFANETLGSASIRINTVPILHHRNASSDAMRRSLSDPVQTGLQMWNECVFNARMGWKEELVGDWVKLVEVVAEIEKSRAVQAVPFIRRLLAIRHFRPRNPDRAPSSHADSPLDEVGVRRHRTTGPQLMVYENKSNCNTRPIYGAHSEVAVASVPEQLVGQPITSQPVSVRSKGQANVE